MFENLTNILKLAYFTQSNTKNRKLTHNSNKLRHHSKHISQTIISKDSNLQQLFALIQSEQPIERWYLQFQLHKDMHCIKQAVYHSFIKSTITIHNLFLMLIQFKIFDHTVWLPIDRLCQLKGGRKNQLCCLIHYTVNNMVGQYGQNQLQQQADEQKQSIVHVKWDREKAQRQMGLNFVMCYQQTMPLQQKIAILPMLIILNYKNSVVLWQKLQWLNHLSYDMIKSVRSNMRRFVQHQQQFQQGDELTERILMKSLQLSEVQGFISHPNIFKAAYELYNFSQLLEFIGYHKFDNLHSQQTYRLMAHNFVIQLFDCFRNYGYDVTKNQKDFSYLVKIIIDNKLYLEELNDKQFLNQYLEKMMMCYAPKRVIQQHTNKLQLSRLVPRCSSANHIKQEYYLPRFPQGQTEGISHEILQNLELEELRYKQLLMSIPESVLTNILNQLYLLRPEYLETLSLILRDIYQTASMSSEDELWSDASSYFYKMQLYLIKNYLPQFLLHNFMALQSMSTHDALLQYTNKDAGMLYYYDIIAFILKANPISYGHFDGILLKIEQDQQRQETPHNNSKSKTKTTAKNRQKKISFINKFFRSFLQKIIVSRDCVMHIISDWLQWKQNLDQNYANLKYRCYLLDNILKDSTEWLFTVINCVCLIKINTNNNNNNKVNSCLTEYSEYYLTCASSIQQQPQISYLRLEEQDYFKWGTLLLMLYYYFHELQNYQKSAQTKYKQSKIDKLLYKQKFLEKLYSVKVYKRVGNCSDPIKQKQTDKKIGIRILRILIIKLDDWQQYYDNHSKNSIMEYSLSYPITKTVKNKLKIKIKGFLKRKQFEQNQLTILSDSNL